VKPNNKLKSGDLELIEKCKEYYYPKFYNNNDPVHGPEHINEVLELAIEMLTSTDEYRLSVFSDKTTRIIIACFIHDIYVSVNRKNHHIKAYEYALYNREDPFLTVLSKYDRRAIAYAVLQHRASDMPVLDNKDNFYSIEGVIVASADRGIPKLQNIINRVKLISGKIDDRAYEHIYEKNGSHGYIQYPQFYINYFGKNTILKLRSDVDEWYLNRT